MSSPHSSRTLSRRAFLTGVGAMVTLMLAQSTGLARAENGDEELSPPAMLLDLTRCVGCNSCALACKVQNNLPNPELVPTGLGGDAYTFVDTIQNGSGNGDAGQLASTAQSGVAHFVKRQCMHCLEPACVAACPSAAMYKSEAGPIVYRPQRCLGCRYCQIACPFGIPTFDWQNPITPRISKCWFCLDRQLQGERPACEEACPTGALHFGRRDELLAQAHGRIASNPDRYVDHI